MAVYWHPFLADLLRKDYGDRLIVEEEVTLGDMPLRVDLLLIRRDPAVALPFPFSCLGERTLVSYKGPDETAGQEDLIQLEIYGLLYALRQGIRERGELTLWLVASRFAADLSCPEGAHLVGRQEVGAGVGGGGLDGFPAFLVDLVGLPLRPEALPLLMVAKGPRERELVEFLIDHFREYPGYVQLLRELHAQVLQEVLRMRQLTPEQIGIDYQALLDLIGKEQAIDLIGEERAIDLIGKERLLELLGEEQVKAWLERRQQRPKGNGEAAPSAL
jgi:hypothetical protein